MNINGKSVMIKAGSQDLLNRSRRPTFIAFSIPGLALYSLFFIYPVFLGLYYSLTDWNGMSQVMNYIGLENYANVFQNARFQKAMMFNLRYTILLMIFVLIIAMLLAVLLNSKIKGITFYRAMLYMPAVLCGITISLVFGQVFGKIIPPIGQILGIDFLSTSILGRKETAMFGILLVHLWQGLAMPTVLFLAGLQTVPADLYEAAAIDGASPWKSFTNITLPFLVPVITMVSILTLKSGLGVFDYIKGLTDGGPMKSTISLSYLIYDDAFARNRFSFAISEAIVVSAILIVFSIIQISVSNRKRVYK